MTFEVTKTSDMFHKYENSYEVELNTLEELIEWCKKTNNNVIIKIDSGCTELEIYDDWRE